MRLKYEKVIHHAIVNNLFRWQYTKKSCNAQGSSKYYLFVTAPVIFQINHCVFLFGIMSRRVNHSQYDIPIANLAECGTHDAQPSFQLKRDLYFSLEVVHYLQVCEWYRQEGRYQDGVSLLACSLFWIDLSK